MHRRFWSPALVAAAVGVLALGGALPFAVAQPAAAQTGTATPIRHLVVIFQENVSFDHYFATYPNAVNPAGEPVFFAKSGTPTVNGLGTPLQPPNNPNSAQPFRLDRSQYETCDQNHSYNAEQRALDSGLVDAYPESTGRGSSSSYPCPDYGHGPGIVMGYYDGNTVTALWNYAQNFALNDNSFGTVFGPSSPGAINLISGQTHGTNPAVLPGAANNGTLYGDADPAGDICSNPTYTVSMTGTNVGDLLNRAGVTWGWFEGGFREAPGAATCTVSHANKAGVVSTDYIPHHEPFQYFASTANPLHLPPSSIRNIGKTDQANHQYDLSDFGRAVDAGVLPAVSFLKARAFQDGHAGYSDPLDEQFFIANTINHLERSRFWHDTAVVIAYDDSDGWYDHVMPPLVNHSQDPTEDAIVNATCGAPSASTNGTPASVLGPYQDRCGYGPRLPLLLISPYAKSNFVDNTITDQTSILRFIEDNWHLGRIGNYSFDVKAGTLGNMLQLGPGGPGGPNKLFLNPCTGQRGGGGTNLAWNATLETTCPG